MPIWVYAGLTAKIPIFVAQTFRDAGLTAKIPIFVDQTFRDAGNRELIYFWLSGFTFNIYLLSSPILSPLWGLYP